VVFLSFSVWITLITLKQTAFWPASLLSDVHYSLIHFDATNSIGIRFLTAYAPNKFR
jgi:hypothetical protein